MRRFEKREIQTCHIGRHVYRSAVEVCLLNVPLLTSAECNRKIVHSSRFGRGILAQ